MAAFRYRAMTRTGATVSGVVEAPNQDAVIEHVRGLGHYPISSPTVAGGWREAVGGRLRAASRPSDRDLGVAAQELATLLHAGLPLDRALAIIVGLGRTGLTKPLQGVLSRVRGGATLADSLAAEGQFPKFFISMARAGEMGGNLEAALRRLADYLGKASALRAAIVSALIYPAMLLVTAGLSIFAILVFVLPQFESMFRAAGKALPLSTRVVMGLGGFLSHDWWAVLTLGVLAVAALRRALRDPSFRYRWDARCLRLPILGPLLTQIQLERFSRTLGTLICNGVALPTALEITRATLSNTAMAAAIATATSGLREGDGLADRLRRTAIFPSVALDFVRVGEETGRLDDMLLRQADLCDESVKHTTQRLLAVMVPLLTIVIGMVVAGLIASILVAIISINELAL